MPFLGRGLGKLKLHLPLEVKGNYLTTSRPHRIPSLLKRNLRNRKVVCLLFW